MYALANIFILIKAPTEESAVCGDSKHCIYKLKFSAEF